MDVSELLKKTGKYKSTEVVKDVESIVDTGNMMVFDSELVSNTRDGEVLKSQCRSNVQLLVNDLWKLPVISKDEAVVVTLPKSTVTRFPREKPVPKPKEETKWEKFAREKGIVKRKRERMVFDDAAQEYKPRFGYKGINQNDKPWVIPLSDQADPYEDPYAKLAEEKKARVEKNEKQRVKNLKLANKANGFAAPTADEIVDGNSKEAKQAEREAKKEKIMKGLTATKFATASYGKFDKKLADEPKQLAKKKTVGNRVKREPVVGSIQTEQSKYMSVLKKITGKDDILNAKKAANRTLYGENSNNTSSFAGKHKTMKQGKKRSSSGGKKSMKSSSGKGGAKGMKTKGGKVSVKGLGKRKSK
eukprot:Nk52_evm37s2391 gene=Nk52_evmTU37s2391